jgi:hypothetical protein
MTPEGKVKAEVIKALKGLTLTGDVIYWERMNSGSIHGDGLHVSMCRVGTFDFIVIFQDAHKNLIVAFVEVKRGDMKMDLSPSQKQFKKDWDGRHRSILFWMVQSGKQLKTMILSLAYNRVNDIEM